MRATIAIQSLRSNISSTGTVLPPRDEEIEVRTMAPTTRPMAIAGSPPMAGIGEGRSVVSVAMEVTVATMDEDSMGLLEGFRPGRRPLPHRRQAFIHDLEVGSDAGPS